MQRAGPVHMLNLLEVHARAIHDNGTEATGAAAHRAYARDNAPVFQRLGGRQVWIGRPELLPIGPQAISRDRAFIAGYPSLDSFVSMLRDPEYRCALRHRQAAAADSRLIRMEQADPGSSLKEIAG